MPSGRMLPATTGAIVHACKYEQEMSDMPSDELALQAGARRDEW